MAAPRVAIQQADFDVSAELAQLRAADHRVGAVCSFVGTVRAAGQPGGPEVLDMELEH
ncbi:MAG: molybdenum cofactor biosynthesis protein MoaE, partial [Ramlibacter sp.]